MSQWERLMQLHPAYTQQLHDLYDKEALPMDVRHYLSAWIESQQWVRAASDYDVAMVLFQVLLENLDIQYSRFVQEDSFLMQHNFRRYKQNFQKYQENPCLLALNFCWYLDKEKAILETAELAAQVQVLEVEQGVFETSTQCDIDHKMSSLKTEVQYIEHATMCLEEQQDEFDFKYKTFKMEETMPGQSGNLHEAKLQSLINKLNDSRKNTLFGLKELLEKAEHLIGLVNNERVQWQRRQQKHCIGAPLPVCLDQLETWFTCVAESLFQVREFLSKLEELAGKISYEKDPIKALKPSLQLMTEKLLTDLLKSSFVVETQPTMPQGKGPLVLRTGVQFFVKTRLLVKFPDLNHSMKVNVSMDREAPQIKRYRHFNVLGTTSKALNMSESKKGGMVADFRHLNLREQKGGGGKGATDISLSVTEELHFIYFNTLFEFKGMSVELQATSLPVVIISNASQQQSAWASVLWFNMLNQDTKDLMFFASSPAANWPQFGEMLSWQFLSATQRGLNETQLEMIANRLFGKQPNYDICNVAWPTFSKENSPDTFWVWFDSIVIMVKAHLEKFWRDGLIMGFISKSKEKALLKKKQRGTFLLRFSESVIGGITCSWVENNATGDPSVKTIQPFTKDDLTQIPLQEIIRHFLILKDVPQNPLLYLYPDTPRDEAFGKYYADNSGIDSPYLRYIKTRLVFVLKGDTLEPVSNITPDVVEDDVAVQPVDSFEHHDINLFWDPMLSDSDIILGDDPMYPSTSNHFFDSELSLDGPVHTSL